MSGNAAVQSKARASKLRPWSPSSALEIRLLPTSRFASRLSSGLPCLAVFSHKLSLVISILSAFRSTPNRLLFKISLSALKTSRLPVIAPICSFTLLYSASSTSKAATRNAPEPQAGSHTLSVVSSASQARQNASSTTRSGWRNLLAYFFSSAVGLRSSQTDFPTASSLLDSLTGSSPVLLLIS